MLEPEHPSQKQFQTLARIVDAIQKPNQRQRLVSPAISAPASRGGIDGLQTEFVSTNLAASPLVDPGCRYFSRGCSGGVSRPFVLVVFFVCRGTPRVASWI